MSDQPAKLRLDVLPSSGKAEQLRAEFAKLPPAEPGGAVSRDAVIASSDAASPLRDRVIATLQTVYDPELPVNIFDLGLIYGVDVSPEGDVHVRMTLTTPACPVAGSLPGEVQRKLQTTDGVRSAKVELVWDPPWDKSRMSEAALLELGIL